MTRDTKILVGVFIFIVVAMSEFFLLGTYALLAIAVTPLLIALPFALYFYPTIKAYQAKKKNTTSIGLTNFFFGLDYPRLDNLPDLGSEQRLRSNSHALFTVRFCLLFDYKINKIKMKKTETKQKIIVLLSVIFVVFSVVVFVNASFSSDEKNSTMKTYTVDKERAKKEAQIRKELDEKVKNGTQSWRKEKRLKEIQERNKQQKNNTIRVGSRMKTADLVICASTRSVLNEATSASHSGRYWNYVLAHNSEFSCLVASEHRGSGERSR